MPPPESVISALGFGKAADRTYHQVLPQSGRELVFGLYINNIPIVDIVSDVLTVISEQGAIVEAIYERT